MHIIYLTSVFTKKSFFKSPDKRGAESDSLKFLCQHRWESRTARNDVSFLCGKIKQEMQENNKFKKKKKNE